MWRTPKQLAGPTKPKRWPSAWFFFPCLEAGFIILLGSADQITDNCVHTVTICGGLHTWHVHRYTITCENRGPRKKRHSHCQSKWGYMHSKRASVKTAKTTYLPRAPNRTCALCKSAFHHHSFFMMKLRTDLSVKHRQLSLTPFAKQRSHYICYNYYFKNNFRTRYTIKRHATPDLQDQDWQPCTLPKPNLLAVEYSVT